jgi:hypothetical protein
MAQISIPQAYRVDLTEYERGWGSKPFDTVYFDNEQEARKYAEDYNLRHNNQDTVPDWYVRADYRGRV